MIIEQTEDMELVKSILTVDGIWENIGGHLHDKTEYTPDDTWLYVIGRVDGEPVGMVLVHDTVEGHKQCHVQMLPEHRKEHSKEFGVKGMEWIWANTGIDRMVAAIPEIYPNVRKYAELQGFKVYRTLRKSYEKNGILSDRWLLEIKRK